MFSNDCSIELTFRYFYILFNYFSFLGLKLNRYKSFLFIRWFIHEILFFGFFKISFKTSFVDFWLVCIIFIGSVFIDPVTCTRMWLQIVSGTYTNRTYGFEFPACLCKVMVRVTVFVIATVAINTLIVFKAVPKVWQFLWMIGDWFINITKYCSFWWVSIFINKKEEFYFCWGSI